MTSQEQNPTVILDESNDRAYFTMIPNIVGECGLSVYAFRLYCQIKRVAGEDGKCWQSTRTLAKNCKMSLGSVSKAKIELEEAGLIVISQKKMPYGGMDYHEIVVVDIWKRNVNEYESRKYDSHE